MTLVTCTPYAVNTHRLLVRGRRVEYTGEEKSKTVSQLQPAAMARRLVDVWPWFLFMMAGGHVLIEDIPGVGKTSMALAFARAMNLTQNRVQFTPDVLPSDITGISMYIKEKDTFVYQPGAVMCNLFLADEINRATPKTQSSLLECMAERQITVDGVTRPLEEPFLVIATQNPLETLGTFPLPEAQMDRFLMKLSMEALSPAEETQMIARFLTEEPLAELSSVCQKEEIRALQEACKEVYLHPELVQYLVRIVQETRVNSKIASGVSPRGTLAFLRAVQGHALVQGRNYVVPEDFKTVAVPVLAHRLTMQIGADDGRAAESVIEEILNRIDLPTENWSGR